MKARFNCFRQVALSAAASVMGLSTLLVGCQGSMGNPLEAAPRKRPGVVATSAHKKAAATADPGNLVLRINGDTLDPGDIVKDLGPELVQRRGELPGDQYRLFVEQRAAQWLSDRITESLLYNKASLRMGEGMEKNVDRHVDAEIRRVVTREHGGVQHRFEKALEAQGMTLEYYRERVRREAVISSFLEGEIKGSIAEPSRKELLAVYDLAAQTPSKEARRSMSLIEVRPSECLSAPTNRPTVEQMAAARAEAGRRILAAQAALRSGRPFADVAREYSHDSRSADGGSWGFISQGSVRERYEPAVQTLYTLGSGQVSDIIEGPDSLFIVRCDHAESTAMPSFGEMQPELRERYFRNEYNRAVRVMIDELRRTARLEPSDLSIVHRAAVEKAISST